MLSLVRTYIMVMAEVTYSICIIITASSHTIINLYFISRLLNKNIICSTPLQNMFLVSTGNSNHRFRYLYYMVYYIDRFNTTYIVRFVKKYFNQYQYWIIPTGYCQIISLYPIGIYFGIIKDDYIIL